jgi:hypothetical protein
LNKLEEGSLRDYATAFCSLLVLMDLEKKIFKDFAFFGFWPMFDLEMNVKVEF